MAIDRQGKRVIIECDSCADTFEGEEGQDFETVMAAAKRDGWTNHQSKDPKRQDLKWFNACPDEGCKKVWSTSR
jgi:hypothetical protein